MWPDNETEKDFLNFSGVANTVAEIITQAGGQPTSIGISGNWGSGKSSMIKLVHIALSNKNQMEDDRFIYVEFNAWLYQGYDDARAALLEIIATKLNEEAEKRENGLDKAKELLKRVNWLRAAKIGVGSALALSLGLPPTGLIGDIVKFGKQALGEDEGFAMDEGLIKAKPEFSPPREIHAIRDCFEQVLAQLKVTLVVFIDDLDRCLPSTTISTLEAIRLFLFLDNTAFVIAADDSMIKHAVRQHFGDIEENLVISYFDKLIQIPIRVPPLGTQEVRAYMILLFVENADIDQTLKENIRKSVCCQLAKSWRGERVDRAFIQSIYKEAPPSLVARFDSADNLAPFMVSASQIAGNPRLVKRFLNALSIRMAISHAHNVGVDEAVLAKMLLFERCGSPNAYDFLIAAVNDNAEGKPAFLGKWEQTVANDGTLTLDSLWDSDFIREWLVLAPPLADTDLRGVLYVSREHAPLITPKYRLSLEGSELLAALLENPDMTASLHELLVKLSTPELSVIMDRVLEQARREQEWGTPPILDACIAVAKADPSLASRVTGFLNERPPGQIKPSIVPKISDQPWAAEVFSHWKTISVDIPVKNAINTLEVS